MPNLNTSAFAKSVVLLRSQIQPGQRTSLLASNRLSLSLLGPGNSPSRDLKGNALRKIRLEKGIDPVVLATQACISLGQLYSIETGVQDHFYSPVLREQTAKRVARLLAADWDCIESFQTQNKPASNVIRLQRAHQSRSLPSLDFPVRAVVSLTSKPIPPVEHTVFMGLMTPSAEADHEAILHTAYQSASPLKSRTEHQTVKNSPVLYLSLFLAFCAAFIFFFFEPAFAQALANIGTDFASFFL